MASLPAVAWQNTDYQPVIGTSFLRPTLLPSETVGSSIGATGTDNNSGIYQIDVFTEASRGRGASNILEDLIADHFKANTDLTYNGVIVNIVSASILTARNEESWYHVPVEIRYLSFTTKR